MPQGKQKLQRSLQHFDLRKRNVSPRYSGLLGVVTNGEKRVEITSRPGYVWVRLRNVNNEVIKAYNDQVSPIYDLPVIVERDKNHPTRYIITGRDVERYSIWPSNSAYLPKHGQQHSFNKDDVGTGGDITWVYNQQFMPFLVIPSGTYGGPGVIVSPGVNFYDNTYTYLETTGTASLLSYKPSGTNQASCVLLYLDQTTTQLGLTYGGVFDSTITGTAEFVPYLPAPPTGSVGLAGIRLTTGTSSIGWANIYDVRPFVLSNSGAGGAAGGSGNIKLWSNGESTDYPFTETGLINANAAASSGDIVYIPVGTIALTAEITIQAGVGWVGQDRTGTILTYSGADNQIITTGNGSYIENLTINFTSTYAGTFYAIRCTTSYFKNISVTANDNGSGSTYAIYGTLHYKANASFVAIDNCFFKTTVLNTAVTNSRAARLDAPNNTDYGSIIVQDSQFYAYSVEQVSTVTSAIVYAYTDNLKLIFDNCTFESRYDNYPYGGTLYSLIAGGDLERDYNGNKPLLSFNDCNFSVYAEQARAEVYGVSLEDSAIMRNCYSYVYTDNSGSSANSAYTIYAQDYLYDCIGVCESVTGSYGLRALGYDLYLYGGQYNGVMFDIWQDDANDPLYVQSCQYQTYKNDGGGILLLPSDVVPHDEITSTSAGVAAATNIETTQVTTNGDSDLDNVTLANGYEGQIKRFVCVSKGNAADSWKITPTSFIGASYILFSGSAGQGCIMEYINNEGWAVIGNNGGTIV